MTRDIGDKAYSSKATRARLRERGIGAVIAEPADQQANRARRGAKGGRPPAFDAEGYKLRNVVERSFNLLKQWRALTTRYDKLAIVAIDWRVSVDSTINRAHQHATNTKRPEKDTGGSVESQESAPRRV